MFVSKTYELIDALVYENALSEGKVWNTNLNDIDFHVEMTVHPTTSDNSFARILFRENSSNYLNFGDLYANANCGVQWSYNGTTSSFYGKAIQTDADTKVIMERKGTNITLTVAGTVYNISNMPMSMNILERAVITNNTIKDFMIYPI